MTTRLTLFDSPLFLGFDQFEKTIDRMRKAGSEGYPPYNIEQIGQDGLKITLAVAGFSIEDLDVEIENNQLSIRGKQKEDLDKIYLHRGIAARQFIRSYVLADGIEVTGAELDNGLLHIYLQRIMPESAALKIEIKGSKTKEKNLQTIDLETSDKQSR